MVDELVNGLRPQKDSPVFVSAERDREITLDKGRHTLSLKVLKADRNGFYETDETIEV